MPKVMGLHGDAPWTDQMCIFDCGLEFRKCLPNAWIICTQLNICDKNTSKNSNINNSKMNTNKLINNINKENKL